jgi:hypothetical protein
VIFPRVLTSMSGSPSATTSNVLTSRAPNRRHDG